jgi:hypothetical protein
MNMQIFKGRLQATVAGALCALLVAPVQAVTPIQTEIQKLLADDGDSHNLFGYSVAIDGDRALIGAFGSNSNAAQSGSAYVFHWNGGAWVQQAELLASDAEHARDFGYSVDLDGDIMLIGDPEDNANGVRSGSAYVFRWNGSAWVQQAKLLPSDGAAGDNFGYSVTISGDIALVGAYADDDNGGSSGSAYVFRWNGSAWVQQAKLLASDGAAGDVFGWSVALDGDFALIGAYRDDDMDFDSGSAYVFRWNGSAWLQQAKLTATDGAFFDNFGISVAIDGDTALVGAQRDFDDGFQSGSAYVFHWNGSAWVQQAKLLATDGADGDGFGWSVALDGDFALIGAYRDDDMGVNSGSAYVFGRSGGAWSESLKLLASDSSPFDELSFRTGVSISGARAIAGAPFEDSNGSSAGAAYIFELQSDDQPPMVSDVLIAPNPVAYNTAFTIGALVEDGATGSSPIASASYSINGGPASAMSASDGAFDTATEQVTATVSAGLDTGVYSLCVSGEDSAGNASEPACTLLAVYDPSAGFVTGGGWIQSPLGAYSPDPNLMGKANFGFVAKYKKGANVPTGQTEFHFQAAGLNFHSDNCEWLVVAGARAQFKGTGTINGAGNYGFMISAIDEALTESSDLDLFRIKIWDKDLADQVVYDNQLGADEGSDPTTAIGGGSIVIHKPKGK